MSIRKVYGSGQLENLGHIQTGRLRSPLTMLGMQVLQKIILLFTRLMGLGTITLVGIGLNIQLLVESQKPPSSDVVILPM